jgi:hypothetical protein
MQRSLKVLAEEQAVVADGPVPCDRQGLPTS